MSRLLTFLRRLAPTWHAMASASQSAAAASAHRARYDLFRALGHTHHAALRAASGDEPK